ncbi:hypothetical protein MHC_02115 [Mycoplasma haemocanis str. Illinois]|uniref:Uncharacterized protein n=1 Tax=Mycoplasma haemocanis (strain Illinois) TaxID=1111676 RepID=H6N6L7_MYCHN|nr:hypothetical protein [Mycoplasma haemocanis]AEW45289.1 hypothetical protein MHC_02115 [Mycoplasma haemocanis str. Illinois]
MNKLAVSVVGVAGTSVAGFGGFMFLKNKENTQTSFAQRYKHALLTNDSNLWGSKLTSLKSGVSSHFKLMEAAQKGKENNKDAEATQLLKDGCFLIYKESIKNSKYLDDFKKYCSKTNKEAGSGNWNSDDKNNSSWNSSLDALKNHDTQQYGELDSQLLSLKTELSTKSTPYDDNFRNKLKGWCELVKENIFEGAESKEFKQQEKYCRKA